MWQGNYQQPNTGAPAATGVTIIAVTNGNAMHLTWPIPVYTQPLATSDDPSGKFV